MLELIVFSRKLYIPFEVLHMLDVCLSSVVAWNCVKSYRTTPIFQLNCIFPSHLKWKVLEMFKWVNNVPQPGILWTGTTHTTLQGKTSGVSSTGNWMKKSVFQTDPDSGLLVQFKANRVGVSEFTSDSYSPSLFSGHTWQPF